MIASEISGGYGWPALVDRPEEADQRCGVWGAGLVLVVLRVQVDHVGPLGEVERQGGGQGVGGRGLALAAAAVVPGCEVVLGDAPYGLWTGLVVRLVFGAQASRRYVAFLVCSRRRLPFRLGLFLDWAVTAGLMRYSGPAYQYRHRELHHWLRQHPEPPAAP
ncbi:hypothetical protein [Streptomyces sp. NPDC047071]|uniref:hypothetical protein n=1 Tax=Streptomyces sp. NPDC047071 TaxID=3154808 RepID=UPI00345685B9